ncbi:uncharacterized protein LOC123533591 isoform X2 [Mercenaria mercenaria]|uniref:uncharacterized protein LOC123533591 isoform X2 n=1 Tax=Mercenaria mercenaria TaxID=6596 RepID=UPI00234F9FE6|nr:uncharacterized protein LOC123533591 isoform X2 [Mercenaria mercenaria]
MGKTFAGSNKNTSSKQRNGDVLNSANLSSWEKRLNSRLNNDQDKRNKREKGYFSSGKWDRNKEIKTKHEKCEHGSCHRFINNNSYEVWCICRLVKPCEQCEENSADAERDKTPTPGDTGDFDDSDASTATPKSSTKDIGEDSADGHVDIRNSEAKIYKTANGVKEERKFTSSAKSDVKFSRNNCALGEREISEINETAGINLQELFSKLDELNNKEEANGFEYKQGLHIADTPPGSPTSSMDSASTCSFDHFDFDTSFCSLKSTDTMEPGDLADQLSLVQQMVMEMKTGFAHAMEELSKIQYGDQTLQQQLIDSKKHCSEEIVEMKQVVEELKTEVQKLSGRLEEVSDTQRSLQEKLDTYQSDKDMLLEELEQCGAINDQIRLRLSGGSLKENNNVIPPDVAPMVHPYLNSLQNHHRGGDGYNSDSSLTAAVSRSLNLTQALGEKCLNLDISTASSDDEDNSRHSRSDSGHRAMKRHSSFHREEAARDIADVEREYCSQLWALLEDYMNPLRDSEILGRRELHLLFPSYIPHIYEQHCIILRKIEERMKKWKNTGVIGDIFAKFTESQDGDGLLLYKDFINDFPTIINSMNKWFTHSPHFRELMQSQCLANAPVLPLLLAPLQQVPKYSILLKTLLKHTPADHPDRYYLESSLTRLKQFLNSMNDDLEHAMQAINISSQLVNRSRDTGHSARSKSSASSGEANHISRDSGVHSNEEERAKSPMSPNTTRRYLLQVLREKREQGIHGHARHDGHPSTPRGRKQSGYGSHPDLSHQPPGVQDGRMSPYLNSLPQSKMFSSLSKLPLPRENSNSRRSRSHKTPDGHRPVINRNYLRPLTPQVLPQSTSAHNFESAKRREEYAEKMRQRPASAMEFSYGSHDQQDEFLELLAHQASLAISPPHSSSSDRSRQELQLSLQKLLAETGNSGEQYLDHGAADGHVSYHKQFMTAKDRILRHNIQAEMYEDTNQDEENAQEDYGIYGDDDDDDDYENDADFDHDVKPMKLLQDSHRPKIMVPKWRQNASPQPPSYTRSVTHISKQQTGSTSEENLAASLAQSLFDDKKQSTLPRDKKSRTNPKNIKDNAADKVQTNGSLKRKVPRAESPRKSPARQSPIPTVAQSLPHGKSMSFDASPNRPSNLNLSNTNTQGKTGVSQGGVVSTQVIAPQSPASPEPSAMARPNSFTKLTDVIAYTADCLEKGDTQTAEAGDNNSVSKVKSENETEGVNSGKLTKLDILADENMKVSSVDNSVTSASQNGKKASNESQTNSKLSFATSPVEPRESTSPVNTDNVVYYFQNRNKINQGNTADTSNATKSRLPTFASMEKTSTPVKEQKHFQPVTSVSPTTDTFSSFTGTKKESGRFVRGDEVNSENKVNEKNKNTSETDDNDVKDDSEGATKERVLRAVDKLRLSFERKKQISEERRQLRTEVSSPTNASIQKQFNEINVVAKKGETKPVVLRTFSSPTNQVVVNSPVDSNEPVLNGEPVEQKQGLYRKAGSSKTPSKFQSDSSASARQIQKLERATSPTARSTSPTMSPYEKFKSQVENSNLAKPARRGTSPQRNSAEVSLIPKRSKSPTRASVERERPKSTNDLGAALAAESDGSSTPMKSAMKETKIPVLKKSGAALSKSSEDVSKIKKKSHFKDQLKNIFGRKKKKSKLYSYNGYDPDEEYNNHVTIETEASFQLTNDVMMFPLTKERRSNSTSQILQSYQFEDDDDDDEDPISEV